MVPGASRSPRTPVKHPSVGSTPTSSTPLFRSVSGVREACLTLRYAYFRLTTYNGQPLFVPFSATAPKIRPRKRLQIKGFHDKDNGSFWVNSPEIGHNR